MAYAYTSELGHPRSRLAALFADFRGFFALLGAALRVARAVEDRRQPAAGDLNILGIEGPLPGMR